MNEQKFIERMTGYKATNADLTCQGFQYEIGKWFEHPGEVKLCPTESEVEIGTGGFHFTVHPSGPWCYYSASDTRVFKIEAEQVLDLPVEPGADYKLVCKRIRLVEEITPGGDSNTGDSNTGDSNTGDWNTGDSNTGDSNTGDSNTGDSNTGDSNTGYRNTGYRNTGYRNTGYRNTGDNNTGYRNTGDWNTGYWNTGDWNTGYRNTGDSNTGYSNTGYSNTGDSNTGDWNATDRSCGFFCIKEPKVVSFDLLTELTAAEFLEKFPEAYDLGRLLHEPAEIKFADFKNIPGITKAKLVTLHQKHLAAKNV